MNQKNDPKYHGDPWQMPDTLKVAIQTVDQCNNKCHLCPYPHTYHTGKLMTDEVFLRIVEQLALYMSHHGLEKIKFDFFLQNEPLLDSKLFDRIKMFKKVLPGCKIEISSNGLLIHRFEKELIEHCDYLFFNIGAWNAESYNAAHRVKITQEHFDRMWEVAHSIQSHFDKGKCVIAKFFEEDVEDVNKPEEWYNREYSRAGFLNGNIIYHDKIRGCYWDKHRFFNFLVDGSLILCYQDWIRETIQGNIMHQSLIDIDESRLRRSYINKVEGIEDSEPDFICKRCEICVGDNKYEKEGARWNPKRW